MFMTFGVSSHHRAALSYRRQISINWQICLFFCWQRLLISYKSSPKQENMYISWKKLQKNLVEQKKCSIFAPAFENDACWFGNNIRLEGWVSGWNHQFAKLTCGLPYRGFESPTFRKHYSKLHRWSIHLMVRIQDSQSWHRGSIPLSTTTTDYDYNSKSAQGIMPQADCKNGRFI